ncbi:cytoplasmic dynein 2 intermediate chain 1 isoform X1 [Odontesthes bonariensis]|uniref:cytoplasmic dynein 2 intermediate chain 1 isoform X1 n=1 Tax=Odontesthes bonariensis TaxID=219752 RepID=UPI003F58973E
MHSDKKITKEDTWRPADLRRHIREKDLGGDYARRREDNERKHRGGESTERRHRDLEEPRPDKDKLRERESSRVRGDEDRKERHAERRKEGSQTRRSDKDREMRRDERDREKIRLVYDDRKNRERERDKDRHKDKEKERVRDKERHAEEDRSKRREDKDKERRREERDREHRSERRRPEESGEGIKDHIGKQHREQSDRRHRNDDEDKRKDRHVQERHGDRKHSERKEEREYKEEHRRHREDRDRRHKNIGHHDEKWKHEIESREHRDLRRSGEDGGRSRGDSDRAERDKHRERRKKVEEDAETRYKEKKKNKEEEEKDDIDRNQRDTSSSKKSSSDKSHRHEKKEAVAEQVVKQDELAEQEYDDDFEDYEEDFEEMDESADEGEVEKESLHPEASDEEEKLTTQQRKEIEAIQRAMAAENERAGTAQSRQSTNREEEDVPRSSKGSEKSASSLRGKFIDFVAAKQREVSKKVATKQKKRSTELLRLIDLDFSTTFCLLDLPPVSEYELYIRNFGNTNTKQAYVQCNEDNVDRDIQTEEIEISEKWTQHPSEHSGSCGDPNLSQDKSRSDLNIDSKRLISFLHSASQVMVVLLEEDQAQRNSQRKLKTHKESLSFSDGSLQLNTNLPFLYGRQISLVHFSEVQRHTMMSVHMPTAKPSAVRLDSWTIICIWNIWEPSRPQKILVYESEVQCCCFSSGKATLVFAGTSVGSVVLWDLREYARNHYRLKIGEDEWTFRQPTFSTDAVMGGSGHFSSVTAVEVVPSPVAGGLRAEVPFLASEEESSGLSFQLASLDESGVLNFWVVVELPKGNEAGSPTDLGLRPGGKVKLLHSSSLLAAERGSPRDAVKTGPLQTLLLKFLQTDSNHFFIGTNLGLVNHGTSHGLSAPPKFYRFREVEMRPVDVTSIHFSPFKPNMFLVGCGDGSIRLHAVSHELPVAEWKNSTAGEPVVSLQWAQTTSAVFCVLDAASNLHIWDLLKDDVQPVVRERISADRVTTMAVFGDSGKKPTYSGIALAHESGKIELHYFTKSFTVSSSAEGGTLDSLMTEAF